MIVCRSGYISIFLVLASIVVVAKAGSFSGPDIPNVPYCGSSQSRCCNGREDGCSVPILGTLCYCDQFCNRTRNDDCCPDYFSFCLGIDDLPPPQPTIRCYRNNRYLNHGETIKENCNECTCTDINGNAEIVCDADPCMVDEQLISRINSRSSWIAQKYDKFWGRKLKEGIELRTGTLNPEKSTHGMYPLQPTYSLGSIPQSFNAMDNWRGKISPIVDQGWCGSSWAVSTAQITSDSFAILSKGYETPLLSAQQLISCNNRGQQSCKGGHIDRAWQYIRKYGLVNEECFPYVGGYKKCPYERKGTLASSNCVLPEHKSRKMRYHVAPAYKLGNESDIMYEITYSGPVQATMRVYQDFFSYSDGVYQHSGLENARDFGYHSVRIVGWGSQEGLKYWLVANTWGEDWGENGYFKIVRGRNECDIEQFVVGALANARNQNYDNNRVPLSKK